MQINSARTYSEPDVKTQDCLVFNKKLRLFFVRVKRARSDRPRKKCRRKQETSKALKQNRAQSRRIYLLIMIILMSAKKKLDMHVHVAFRG